MIHPIHEDCWIMPLAMRAHVSPYRPPNTTYLAHLQLALPWMDLPSHLRLRETCAFYGKEVPSAATTLVVTSCLSGRRCLETIFFESPIFSVTMDFAHPEFFAPLRLRTTREQVEAADRTIAPLLKHYRSAELRVNNMLSGIHFSDTLHALEDNLASIRENLHVLQLGLITQGP